MVTLPPADGSGDQGGAHSDSGGTVEGHSDREVVEMRMKTGMVVTPWRAVPLLQRPPDYMR